MNNSETYLQYIFNAGGNPLIEWFDDDWEPIGPQIRKELEDLGLAYEVDGRIHIVEGKY